MPLPKTLGITTVARFFLFILFLTSSSTAFGKGLSPYLPLNMAPEVELQVEKLIALTGQTPLSKPYKALELMERLPEIQNTHPRLYARLSAYLSRYKDKYAITHRGLALSDSDDNERTLENNRGIESKTQLEISGAGHAFYSPYLYAALGGIYSDENGYAITNTHIGIGYEFAQLDIGYREHWLSPFQDSAMLFSTHAENSPSITLSNSRPIGDWNFRFETFYSRLEEVTNIRFNGARNTGHPKLTGLHLSASPTENWSVGWTRTNMFGGGLRGQGLENTFQSLFAPGLLENKGREDRGDEGYLQTAISSKWHSNFYLPMSFYLEFASAESRDSQFSQYQTHARSFGVFIPTVTEHISFRYEYTNRDSGWYQSPYYSLGFSNDNQIIGHWSADEFANGFAPSAKTHHVMLDWELFDSQLLAIHVSGQEIETSTDQRVEDTYQVKTRYSIANRHGFWGLEGTYGKDAAGEHYHRLSGFFRW